MGWFGDDDEAKTIVEAVNALEESGMTIYALKALDYLVPGEWVNRTNIDDIIKNATGETDADLIAQVKKRMVELYQDENEGYASAISIFSTVDSTDQLLGASAMADKLSEKFSMLSFLGNITPKADTAQTIDLCVKIAAELLTFTKVNGLPGDSFADFAKAFGEYAGDSKMRMAALVCFDGVLPLGPDFVQLISQKMGELSESDWADNSTFSKIVDYIPGSDKIGFISKAFDAVKDQIAGFVASNNLDTANITEKLSQYVELADDKLDYVAAFIDMSTNYFEHTGIQSVASRMAERAINEI